MTIKALFIAPYPAMENLIEECRKEEHVLDLQIKIGNLHEGVTLAKEAEFQGFDVIVSRGGTAKLIEEAVRIPVVDVQISGYDMLRVLTIANDFKRKKAIVGFSNITLGAKSIIDLLEIPIDIFTIDSENETEPLLTNLKHEGYELIMGDVVTIEYAAKMQLIGILIQSGREAIFDAFKEAKAISRWLIKSKLETTRFKSVLKVTAGDFMVLSNKGEVLYEQWKSFNARPTVEALFESKLNLKNPTNREVIQVKDSSGIPLKLVQTKLELSDSTNYIIEFSQLNQNEISQSLKTSIVSPPLLIHQSEAMVSCLTLINKCLSYKYFALIGENGSGKELIARYIHFNKFNENGLFGLIKAADLVLFRPEAFDPEIKTIYIQSMDQLDKRFINKFNQNIDSLEQKGKVIIFSITQERNLLFNRIYEENVSRIPIPALVDRKEDIRELATSFILHFHQTLGTSPLRITEKGLALLEAYDWPGNVEELKALIKDAVLMEKGYVISDKLVTSLLKHKHTDSDHLTPDLLKGSLESIEKEIIERVLEEEDFNQTKAAKRLNINRSTLWRKLKRK